MKIIHFILTILLCSAFTWEHDVAIALFHISNNQEQVQIKMSFDLEDLSKSMRVKANMIDKVLLQTYLNEHTTFQFNEALIGLEVKAIERANYHMRVKADFTKKIVDIHSITIQNTCLIEVEKHSNIIQIDLNQTSRDFRMHKDRTSIEVLY